MEGTEFFDTLYESLFHRGFFYQDGALDLEVASKLCEIPRDLFQAGSMEAASVGRGLHKKKRKQIRNDFIYWIRDWDLFLEAAPCREKLESILLFARERLFIPVKRVESHFSFYPVGSFYKKHLDQHQKTRNRQLSCIFYLSPWKPGDGGELKIYLPKGQSLLLPPLQGRFVCFLSREILHEVLPTRFERVSLTSWIRDDEILL